MRLFSCDPLTMHTATMDLTEALKALASKLRADVPSAIEDHTERLREEVPEFFVRAADAAGA
jgi:hypothetical protein